MKRLSILLVLVLVVSSLFGCTQKNKETEPSGSNPTTTQPTSTPNNELGLGPIDWELTVTPISAAGQPLDETHTFTLKGEFSDASESSINMLLDFSFGADLPYFIYPAEKALPHSKAIYRHFGYYTYCDWYFVRNTTDEFHMMYCAIDPIMGFAIFYFSDGTGHYYVGSVEPDTNPMSIYEHFHRFAEEHNPAPSEPKDMQIDWNMDAKMIHGDGQLISNGTMMIEGRIVKQEDTNDLLLLNLTLPSTVRYRFTDHTQTDEGFFVWETELPYYFSAGYCYSITANEPVFYHFALDAEMGYFIAEWENLPGQYLIACRDGEVDPAVILAHFQVFIDRFAFAH